MGRVMHGLAIVRDVMSVYLPRREFWIQSWIITDIADAAFASAASACYFWTALGWNVIGKVTEESILTCSIRMLSCHD